MSAVLTPGLCVLGTVTAPLVPGKKKKKKGGRGGKGKEEEERKLVMFLHVSKDADIQGIF